MDGSSSGAIRAAGRPAVGHVGTNYAGPHIALHDPASVLADIAAKRAIVDECERAQRYEDHGWALADAVLRLLALPYQSHPDYQQAWRPL
jgi:hypothetical protein